MKSDMILFSETLLYFDLKSPMTFDGTSDIQCLYENGRLVTLSQHELDLVKRICLELRLVHTPTLSLEECMMAYGKVYDTLLVGKKESSKKKDWVEWKARYGIPQVDLVKVVAD